MGFFSAVMLAFLFWQDTRKTTYELLHTKPVSSWQYILGKVAGGFLVCCILPVSYTHLVIVDGLGNKEEIANRVSQIRGQIEETKSDFDREKLQERLAKLAGGVAVIRVGAATETEMKEAKLRLEAVSYTHLLLWIISTFWEIFTTEDQDLILLWTGLWLSLIHI